MTLFKHNNKKKVATSELGSTTSQAALLPIQNVYSAYSRLPSPVLTVDYSADIACKSNYNNRYHQKHDYTTEKFSQQQVLIKEAEERAAAKLAKKSPYSRILCCFCFPCLPMWTRTICCFIFLGICGFSCILLFFTMSFRQPQVVLNSVAADNLAFNYNVYNGNYFEMNFEKIKAVIYYPTANKTTVGIGEVSDLVLRPHAVTNITFPIQLLSGVNETNDVNTTSKVEASGFSAFKSIINKACIQETTNENRQKEVEIVYDLMPTFRFGNYGVFSLSFTGQTAKMACEKLQTLG